MGWPKQLEVNVDELKKGEADWSLVSENGSLKVQKQTEIRGHICKSTTIDESAREIHHHNFSCVCTCIRILCVSTKLQ